LDPSKELTHKIFEIQFFASAAKFALFLLGCRKTKDRRRMKIKIGNMHNDRKLFLYVYLGTFYLVWKCINFCTYLPNKSSKALNDDLSFS